jgi:hypothetical protein
MFKYTKYQVGCESRLLVYKMKGNPPTPLYERRIEGDFINSGELRSIRFCREDGEFHVFASDHAGCWN